MASVAGVALTLSTCPPTVIAPSTLNLRLSHITSMDTTPTSPLNGQLDYPMAPAAEQPDHPSADEGADKISAYYSLSFPNFTYYLQTLSVTIGRRSVRQGAASSSELPQVDVDLGPLKSVSRLHARIEWEDSEDRFVLVVLGRNGAWVDGIWSGSGSRVPLGARQVINLFVLQIAIWTWAYQRDHDDSQLQVTSVSTFEMYLLLDSFLDVLRTIMSRLSSTWLISESFCLTLCSFIDRKSRLQPEYFILFFRLLLLQKIPRRQVRLLPPAMPHPRLTSPHYHHRLLYHLLLRSQILCHLSHHQRTQ